MPDFRAKIRMYRQGLGDCFLITLPKTDGENFYVMIDCGVVLGTTDASKKMQPVLEDIATVTNGEVDLFLVTHEHWDHLSGVHQAREAFDSLKFKEVWLGWTEDDNDPLAQKLGSERKGLRIALEAAANRMRLADAHGPAEEVESLLDFFGAAGETTTEALKHVKSLNNKLRYCKPTDAPVRPEGVAARFYILGPPLDEKLIKKYDPSKSTPETYGIDAMDCYLSATAPALIEADPVAPFDTIYQIPQEEAVKMPFFSETYWANSESWRRIDTAWLENSTTMALMLDSATNNTSLVLAIELDTSEVLLFAADAQVGNWLSWQDLSWQVGDKQVSGPDLLRRAIFYKTGHHGSHNATLREKGLEMMTELKVAMIPVDHDMAVKRKWGNIPLQALMDRLNEKTGNKVLRIDEEVPEALKDAVPPSELYYEITL